MEGEGSSDGPPKRYNTRPKTKSTFDSFESKYTDYIVDTSPKAIKNGRSSSNLDYYDYQEYFQSQSVSRGFRGNQYVKMPNYDQYQFQNDPTVYQRRMIPPNYSSPYLPNVHNVPPQMEMMYKNPHYAMHMNYRPPTIPGVMPHPGFNQRMVKPMPYPQDPSFNIANEQYTPNMKAPIRPPPNYGYQQMPYPPHYPQQPFAHPSYKASMPIPKPSQPDPSKMMNTSDISAKIVPKAPVYQPRLPQLMPKLQPQLDLMPKRNLQRGGTWSSSANDMQNYFDVVDVILNDLSHKPKFENQKENFIGCVSVLQMFKPNDSHKMVNFEYTIDEQFYLKLNDYLDGMNNPDAQFPVYLVENTKVKSEKDAAMDAMLLNLSPENKSNGKLNPLLLSQLNNNVNQIDDEFKKNNIKLIEEKKIHPITIESYKQLSPSEINGLMNLLKDTNIVKSNFSMKYRVKSVINKNDDSTSNYWIDVSDDSDNRYVLRQQLGCFVSNEFSNKRVPLYRNVDFGSSDPSFLFNQSKNKKASKLSHNYLKVSRSYDVFITHLNAFIKIELSKMISEADVSISNVIYIISINCNVLFIPLLFKEIYLRS